MTYPIKRPAEAQYGNDKMEKLIIADLTGGLNITDPIATLPPNEFTSLLNYYYNRQGTLYSRPPYRPSSFKNTTQDKPIVVDIDYAGDIFKLKTLIDYQVFREELSNGWSFNDEVHVVTGVFEKNTGAVADQMVVAVYNSSDEKWTYIWKAAASATTDISVVPFKVNKAFDLIIFPNNTNPERWSPSATTSGGDIVGDLADLGLTAPTAADSFTATGTLSDSAEGLERIAAGVAYYKFSFFYDDENVTTRFGESATTVVTDGNTDTGIAVTLDATKKAKISIAFTTVTVPSTVSKVLIYRAPDSTPEGPFRLVGETEVTSTTAITTFVDTTPWLQEGIEDLPVGTNPSLSGSELSVLNAETVGPYLVGFDASLPSKLIWSVTGSPDVWNPLDFDYLDDTGQKIIEFNRKVYVFTTSSTYQKEDVPSTAFKISNIGCVDGRTVQDVSNGIMWLDYDTIYFADFVQQYGSKGDFPRDVGHAVSRSVLRRSTTVSSNSAFFERRYYVTYTDTEDFLKRTYVYDIDIDAWSEHSARHAAWSRGDNTLFSLGETMLTDSLSATQKITTSGGGAAINVNITAHGRTNGDYVTVDGTTDNDGTFAITFVDVDNYTIPDAWVEDKTSGSITSTKAYIYEHDYSATVSDAGESTYSGKDYHDYAKVAQTTYTGIATITSSVARTNIKVAGDFDKLFFSSLTLEAEGSVISILVTVSNINNEFSVSKTFASGTDVEEITEFAMVFGVDGDGISNNVFAADPDIAADGDATEAGFAGFGGDAVASIHKKIARQMKSNAIGLTLTSTDSRNLSILYIVIYWKPIQPVA